MDEVKKLARELAEQAQGKSLFPTNGDFEKLMALVGEDEFLNELEQYVDVFADAYRERALELRKQLR